MLAVQDYLRNGNTLKGLTDELGINVYHHSSLPLVGLKYNQIESPKTHPVVKNCRGIILEKDTWNVVGKPFDRFFNASEDKENYDKFDWSDFVCEEKIDGSLIIVYNYKGNWLVNTSGSFGEGQCYLSGKSWRELFLETSGLDFSKLDTTVTYVFELYTIHNKIVRSYGKPITFLLTEFHVLSLNEQEQKIVELSPEGVDWDANRLNLNRPARYAFSSRDEITEFLLDKERCDKTFEGVVNRDKNNSRHKVKTKTYLYLHKVKCNGDTNPRHIVPLVLDGEIDEVVDGLPELRPMAIAVSDKLKNEFDNLLYVWSQTHDIEVQKDFALAIIGRTPFTGLLFRLRQQYGKDQTEKLLRKQWAENGESIAAILYPKGGLHSETYGVNLADE